MKKEMFSIHDTVTGSFNVPFAAINANDACRMVAGACTPDTQIYANADDYRMYYVGEFDQATGEFQHAIPVMIMTVREIRDAVVKRRYNLDGDEDGEAQE